MANWCQFALIYRCESAHGSTHPYCWDKNDILLSQLSNMLHWMFHDGVNTKPTITRALLHNGVSKYWEIRPNVLRYVFVWLQCTSVLKNLVIWLLMNSMSQICHRSLRKQMKLQISKEQNVTICTWWSVNSQLFRPPATDWTFNFFFE